RQSQSLRSWSYILCLRLTYTSFIKEHLIPRDISAGVSIRHLFRVRRTQFEDDGLLIRELLLCAKESIERQELASLLWTHTDPALRPRLAVASNGQHLLENNT